MPAEDLEQDRDSLGAFEFGSTDVPELTTDDLANVLLDESGHLWIRDLAVGGRADRLAALAGGLAGYLLGKAWL